MLTAAMMPVCLTAPLDLRGDNVENVRVLSPPYACAQANRIYTSPTDILLPLPPPPCPLPPLLPVPNKPYGFCGR